MGYSKIERHIWHDDRYRALSAHARELYLYLLTSPHSNRLGLYVLPPLYAAHDVQLEPHEVVTALQELQAARRIEWDPQTKLVMILRYLKYNVMENGNVVKAAIGDLEALPFHERFYLMLFRAIKRWGAEYYSGLSARLIERLREVLGEGVDLGDEALPEVDVKTLGNGGNAGLLNPSPNGSGNHSGNHSGNGMANPNQALPNQTKPVRPRARAHEASVETEDPAAPGTETDGQTDEGSSEAQRHPGAVARMMEAAQEYASTLPEARRVAFLAEAKMMAEGEDYTAWEDGRGQRCEWRQRVRLFKLAITQLQTGKSDRLRGALRYVVAQQLDPDRQLTSDELKRDPPPRTHGGSSAGFSMPSAVQLPSAQQVTQTADRKAESREQATKEWAERIDKLYRRASKEQKASFRAQAEAQLAPAKAGLERMGRYEHVFKTTVLTLFGASINDPIPT